MERKVAYLMVVAYAVAGIAAWGHFISRGCFADTKGQCLTPTDRTFVGIAVAAGWPIYFSTLMFEKDRAMTNELGVQ